MKKTIGIGVLALIALSAVAYVSSQLWAQAPAGGVRPASATAPATGKTRVAILNLKYVVTNYRKWTAFQDQYKNEFKVFEDRINPIKKRLEDLAKQVKEGKLDAAQKIAAEKEARKLQGELQDIDGEAREALGKKETDMMVSIYNEVAAACSRFAQANDIDLVMHYNDGSNPVEMNAPQNIQRKIVSGPCTPVYWKQGVDISAEIVQTLNAGYPAAGGAGGAGAGGAGAGGAPVKPN